MNLVLDAGALVAVDRRQRHALGILRMGERNGHALVTSAAVVAQVWRHGARQVNLARVLAGVRIAPLDDVIARRLGALLGASGTADVVDAHVVSLAAAGDLVLTSDPDDLRLLVSARGVAARVQSI